MLMLSVFQRAFAPTRMVCQVPGTLMYRPDYHYQAQISLRTHKDAIRQIRRLLTDAQQDLFRTSCFGPLLQYQDLRYSAVSYISHSLFVNIREFKTF